mgnify:CR=1 FL=1
MKKTVYLFALIALITTVLGCKKEEATKPVSVALNFESLSAESETITLNASTGLHAVATGENITYSWTLDIGTIIGSGSDVTFNGCCTGEHHITCTVNDSGGNSAVKEITIYVIE